MLFKTTLKFHICEIFLDKKSLDTLNYDENEVKKICPSFIVGGNVFLFKIHAKYYSDV